MAASIVVTVAGARVVMELRNVSLIVRALTDVAVKPKARALGAINFKECAANLLNTRIISPSANAENATKETTNT
jgi:hypothetical protein